MILNYRRTGRRFFLLAFFICFFGVTPFTNSFLLAQGLTTGNAAFTGFNADGNDAFAVVIFKDVSSGSNIQFSSEEWDGSSFSGPGGHLTWVAPAGGIAAGTVLVFNNVQDTPTVNTGSIIDDSNINLSSRGDVIYAYTGSSNSSPDTFLGAIATSGDEYNGTDGTLNNTGLNRGSTAILLSDFVDAARYIGGRSGDTQNGYIGKLNVINGANARDDNWNQFNGNGDQSGQVLPFNDDPFSLVEPPTIAFSVDAQTVAEGNTATISVQLLQASNASASVDVVFNSSSSSAQSDDINNQTSTTLQFTNASSGATQDVTIPIPANDGSEGNEKAVFQLKNNTAGSIINPAVQTITINDSKTPNVVINEFLADPPTGATGDANGDNSRSSSEDEFIELVNSSSFDVDITGWQLSDEGAPAPGPTYTFPSGTVIPAGRALVVFGGGDPAGNFGAAVVQTGSGLSLSNGGGFVTLLNETGEVIQSISYGSEGGPDAGDDQSITRDPDITGGFIKHSNATNSGGTIFSPGTKIDETTFGSAKIAVGIRGREGWRFVASPTQNTTFNDLFGPLWTQGVPNSDAPSANAPNLYGWSEPGGGSFNPVAGNGTNEQMTPGRGYIIYVYADDDFRAPGVQGGFPKVVNSNNNENASPVSVAVNSNDADKNGAINGNEGYNLLGNPFGADVSVTAVISALSNVDASINANVYIYDPNAGSGNGQYVVKSSGSISPFQAFFVRYESAGISGNASFNRSDLAANRGTQFYGRAGGGAARQQSFEINLGDGKIFDTYRVDFTPGGKPGKDRIDAYKLFSLNTQAINLFSTTGETVKIAKNALPPVRQLQNKISIALRYKAPHSGKYTFSWDGINDIPGDVDLYLIDSKTARKIDLRSEKTYSFNVSAKKDEFQKSAVNRRQHLVSPAIGSNSPTASGNTRFQLLVVPSSANNKKPKDKEPKEQVRVSHNYPNPFTPANGTGMDVTLKQKMHVTMSIYNIVGQRVATIYDDEMPKGQQQVRWEVHSNIPSGIYLCKIKAGDKIITRKMTLVK